MAVVAGTAVVAEGAVTAGVAVVAGAATPSFAIIGFFDCDGESVAPDKAPPDSVAIGQIAEW